MLNTQKLISLFNNIKNIFNRSFQNTPLSYRAIARFVFIIFIPSCIFAVAIFLLLGVGLVEAISIIGSITGTLSAATIAYTVHDFLYGRRAQIRAELAKNRDIRGNREVVLIIDTLKNLPAKKSFDNSVYDLNLEHINEDMIVKYEWCKHLPYESIDENNISDILSGIDYKLQEVSELSPDVLHLFYAGTTVVATYVGEQLSNRVFTKVYYLDRSPESSKYIYWMSLHKK